MRGCFVRMLALGCAGALIVGALLTPGAAADAGVPPVPTCNHPGNRTVVSCFSIRQRSGSSLDLSHDRQFSTSPTAPHPGYGPADLRSAYALPTSNTTSTVAVVDAYDNPHAEADLAIYRAYYGLAPCTTANGCFRKVNQTGSTDPAALPAPDQGWAGEIALDLAMVSAVCPSCHLLLVEATQASSDLYTAVQTAVRLGARYVSMSWGAPENGSETALDHAYLAATGVVYTAASGDEGYGVNFPASSAHVVAVGGTTLRRASTPRGWAESAWLSGTRAGTGSGCSATVPKPSWQAGISSCPRRGVTDVAAVADPATGVAVYQGFGASGWVVYGGTSAAAPIIAGAYALAGPPAAGDSPASFPYTHPGGLNDVTTGSNGSCDATQLCHAGQGWDGPTGLGTPNGIAAFADPAVASPAGSTALSLIAPGNQTTVLATPVSLAISASGDAPSAYAATGLPTGLHIDATTGVIAGTPTLPGNYSVAVTASYPTGATQSTAFGWSVRLDPTQCRAQLITNGDFHYGSSGWAASRGVIQTRTKLARSGTGAAGLGGYGRVSSEFLSRAVNIPVGCSAMLTYHLRVTSADTSRTPHDVLTVTVNNRQVQTYSNANRGSAYSTRMVRLGASGRVQIRWTARENAGKATAFLIDDVGVTLD